jgi:DNA-directed RNA polymerase subunit M/transcription elongation factor TFIIS
MARIHSKKYRAAENAKVKAAAKRQSLEATHKKECPDCGAKNTAFILYGLPSFDKLLEQDLDNGLIVLGGCDLFEDNPKFQCNECRYSWR